MNKENCALKLVGEIILYYDERSKKTSNCALKLVGEIILYYDERSKKHQNTFNVFDRVNT